MAKNNSNNEFSKVLIPGEEIDGDFIQNTKLFKTIENEIGKFRPKNDPVGEDLFDFALKAFAIELSKGPDYSAYISSQYIDLFYIQFLDIDFNLRWANIKGFDPNKHIEVNAKKSIVKNLRTNENLWFETLQQIAKENLEKELDKQMERIKVAVQFPDSRKAIVIAATGSKKEEYIKSTSQILDQLLSIYSR